MRAYAWLAGQSEDERVKRQCLEELVEWAPMLHWAREAGDLMRDMAAAEDAAWDRGAEGDSYD